MFGKEVYGGWLTTEVLWGKKKCFLKRSTAYKCSPSQLFIAQPHYPGVGWGLARSLLKLAWDTSQLSIGVDMAPEAGLRSGGGNTLS